METTRIIIRACSKEDYSKYYRHYTRFSNNKPSMSLERFYEFYEFPPCVRSCKRKRKDNTHYKKGVKKVKFSLDESKKLSLCNNFSALPDEIVLKILSMLDFTSLICMSKVNKRFDNLSWDPLLYKYLNLEGPHKRVTSCMKTNYLDTFLIFEYLIPRSESVQYLDLSWRYVSVPNFLNVLSTCCRYLTHLRLSNSYFNNFDLFTISKICKNLKELDLSKCQVNHHQELTDKGFLHLTNLKSLECLNLEETNIKTQTLCKILRRNQQMRDLNLSDTNLNIDKIAMELRNSCLNLEKFHIYSTGTLTAQGINALAGCKNLKEIIFILSGTKVGYGNSFPRLFTLCQYLETIDLGFFNGFTVNDLESLTLCKNLKFLNLSGIQFVTYTMCMKFFEKCPKLEKIELFYYKLIAKRNFRKDKEISVREHIKYNCA